jgi:chromosome segregation ATPase
MPLVSLPNTTQSLNDRWQAAATQADVTVALGTDTRVFLHDLLALPDQTARITNLQDEVVVLLGEQADAGRRIIALQTDATNRDTELANRDTRITTLEAEVATLRTQYDNAQITINALSRQAPAAAAQTGRAKIPDPDKFDGTRSKLRQFLAQLRLKAATYNDEQDKLRLAVNCLRGEALDQALPYLTDDRIDLTNLAALIDILERAFGNPNRVADAEVKLNTMIQASREFSSYYAEFQRYAADVTWDEPSKLA